MWGIVQRLLWPILHYFRTIRIPLRVVILGGDAIDIGLFRTAMRDVERWFRDEMEINWQRKEVHRKDNSVNFDNIRAHNAIFNDPIPTLYIITYQDRFPGRVRGAWAGGFGYVASKPNARLICHELLHFLSLSHHPHHSNVMFEATDEDRIGRITPEQVEKARNEARIWS